MSIWRTQVNDAAIHLRCLKQQVYTQRRCLSQAVAPAQPPASGAAKLTNRRLISIHGPDAPKFLQGIITNNVSGDSATHLGLFAAFLTAQGKVLNDVFVYPTSASSWQKEQFHNDDTGFLVEVDGASSELLLKHLKRHKLRSKLKLRLLEDGELDIWSVWKDDRWTPHSKAKTGETLSLTDCRAPGMGQRLLLAGGKSSENSPDLEGSDVAPLAAYTLRRYLRGIPEGQDEIPREESLPMNYNFDVMGGIDFKKGCYIGQELTIRTHHTGVVRRRVLPVQLYPFDSQPPDELEYDPAFSDWTFAEQVDIRKDGGRKRATGKLIANVSNVGLAMCRLEQMSELNVSSESSNFTTSDKFVVDREGGDNLGVKAFVPDWIRNTIRDPKVQKRIE